MTINSRPDLSTVQKVLPAGSRSSKYKPMVLCDETVYNLAQHYYTMDEIAERFSISRTTLMHHHGDAFHAGKDDAMNKPRMLLGRIMNEFAALEEGTFTRVDVPVNTLLAAMKLHAQKYEGLGSKQTIVHEGKVQYDGVTSAPEIIERPEE